MTISSRDWVAHPATIADQEASFYMTRIQNMLDSIDDEHRPDVLRLIAERYRGEVVSGQASNSTDS